MAMVIPEIVVGEKLFEFASQIEWVNKAKSWYANSGVATCDTVAVDERGRICTRGKHFMRADEQGAYPISVYAVDDETLTTTAQTDFG